jgi:hypothetical protein
LHGARDGPGRSVRGSRDRRERFDIKIFDDDQAFRPGEAYRDRTALVAPSSWSIDVAQSHGERAHPTGKPPEGEEQTLLRHNHRAVCDHTVGPNYETHGDVLLTPLPGAAPMTRRAAARCGLCGRAT